MFLHLSLVATYLGQTVSMLDIDKAVVDLQHGAGGSRLVGHLGRLRLTAVVDAAVFAVGGGDVGAQSTADAARVAAGTERGVGALLGRLAAGKAAVATVGAGTKNLKFKFKIENLYQT